MLLRVQKDSVLTNLIPKCRFMSDKPGGGTHTFSIVYRLIKNGECEGPYLAYIPSSRFLTNPKYNWPWEVFQQDGLGTLKIFSRGFSRFLHKFKLIIQYYSPIVSNIIFPTFLDICTALSILYGRKNDVYDIRIFEQMV